MQKTFSFRLEDLVFTVEYLSKTPHTYAAIKITTSKYYPVYWIVFKKNIIFYNKVSPDIGGTVINYSDIKTSILNAIFNDYSKLIQYHANNH